MPAKHHRWQEARYHNSEATHRCAHSESHKPCALGSTTQLSPHREDSAMEHTLNRQTTTILTYINQGRRPVAFPVSLPVRPAVGPVWPRSPRPVRARRAVRRARPGPDGDPAPRAGARAGACRARRATLRVRRGLCPSVSVRAPGAPPAGRMDG